MIEGEATCGDSGTVGVGDGVNGGGDGRGIHGGGDGDSTCLGVCAWALVFLDLAGRIVRLNSFFLY